MIVDNTPGTRLIAMARLGHRLQAVVAVILTLPSNCWGSEGACRQTDEGVKCDSEEGYRLTRLDGGKVSGACCLRFIDSVSILRWMSKRKYVTGCNKALFLVDVLPCIVDI